MKNYWPLALALALAGCDSKAPVTAAAAGGAVAPATTVHAVAAAMEQWPREYQATGAVRARTSTVISAQMMGYAREVNVRVGDRVTAGQLLITLDARDMDAGSERASAAIVELRAAIPEADGAVASAQAGLDLAQATFRRMRQLYRKKSISDQEFDEASARLQAAQASLDMARARRAQLEPKLAQAAEASKQAQVARSYAEITSPVNGLVTVKSIETGSLAVPGAPLLAIESDGYRFEAQVDESKLPAIHIGQSVALTLDGTDRPIHARVSEIVPEVDAASRAFTVKIDLPAAPGLRAGLFGRARFTLGARPVLAIPSAALSEHGQIESVLVAENGVARRRLVTLGDRANGKVEALSGLAPGDLVIASAPAGLDDGGRIEVRQ